MALRRKPRTLAEQLARDLGATAELARSAIRTLYAALTAPAERPLEAALESWRSVLAGTCGSDPAQPSPGIAALAESYRLPTKRCRPAELLFAVQTYYALAIKLLVGHAVAFVGGPPTPAEAVGRVGNLQRLHPVMEQLEADGLHLGLSPWRREGRQSDPFSWHLSAWSDDWADCLRRLAACIAGYDPAALCRDAAAGRDLFQGLYQTVFPARFRHAAGEYYTPSWLAAEMLDEVGYLGQPGRRLLDPACGSGTFLIRAISRLRARAEGLAENEADRGGLLEQVLASVVGFDRNPLAVMTARANYIIALGDLLRSARRLQVPVYLRDSILGAGGREEVDAARFDYVVGNPPWIAWENLPAAYREATKPLWQHYGLFSLSGTEARHGGGKKDLAMLMTYVAADRYLADSGRLAMIVTQTLFQTKGAGDGFRRFRLGSEGPWLKVLRVNDLVEVRPFPAAANWTATILLEKGSPTSYPVPYVRWLPAPPSKPGAVPSRSVGMSSDLGGMPSRSVGMSSGLGGMSSRSVGMSTDLHRDTSDATPPKPLRQERYNAHPIDPNRPTSPWFLWPEGWSHSGAALVGPSDYRAHLGANSGGANGVYWITLLDRGPAAITQCPSGCVWVRNLAGKGSRSVPTVEHPVEAELVYPLLRWGDVARYRAVPRAHVLLAQDIENRRGIEEATMRRRYPQAYAYLERFRDALTGRAAYRRYQSRAAFYSMYDVGPYTVAPTKVVWRRMDRRVSAAVVEPVADRRLGPRPVIPQETCVLIAADSPAEAHYLCAVLNSSVVGFLVESHSVRGGKGFGTPSMLDFLRLARFDPQDRTHAALGSLSQAAHCLAARGEDCSGTQERIDDLAARLYGLDRHQRALIGRSTGGS